MRSKGASRSNLDSDTSKDPGYSLDAHGMPAPVCTSYLKVRESYLFLVYLTRFAALAKKRWTII